MLPLSCLRRGARVSMSPNMRVVRQAPPATATNIVTYCNYRTNFVDKATNATEIRDRIAEP